jgi:hypothetical protein
VPSGGNESAAGSCAFDCYDFVQGFGFIITGMTKVSDLDANIPSIPALEEKALLEESHLVEGVLCGRSGIGRENDTEGCLQSGKGRKGYATAAFD